jgi:hypothetical protein
MTPSEADICYRPPTQLDMMTMCVRQAKPKGLAVSTMMQDNVQTMRNMVHSVQETQREKANRARKAHAFQRGDKGMISTKDMPCRRRIRERRVWAHSTTAERSST